MRKSRNLLAFFLALALFSSCIPGNHFISSAATTGTVKADTLNVRKSASRTAQIVTTLKNGTSVTILSTTKDSSGESWYQIRAVVSKVTYTGYVSAQYITTKATTTTAKATTAAKATTKAAPTTFFRHYGYMKKAYPVYKKTSRSSTIKIRLPKSAKVTAYKKKTSKKVTWYYIHATYKGKTYKGYVPTSKIGLYKTTVSSTTYKLAYCIKNNTLFYKSANVKDAAIGYLDANQQVIRLGSITVNGQAWYKIKASIGTGYLRTTKIKSKTGTASITMNQPAVINTKIKARKIATPLASSKGTLAKNTLVTITGKVNVNGTIWYRLSYTYKGKAKIGYVPTKYVSITNDASFEASLLKFPTSYRPYLTKLHQLHPNWKFVPVNTNLNFATVISKEFYPGINTIQSNCPTKGSSAANAWSVPLSYLSTENGDYNWEKDKFTLRDGTNWYTVSKQALKYYMDPRNFLTEQQIFQFEALSYNNTQTSTGLTAILKNTFMKGSYSAYDYVTKKTVTGTYNKAFMDAASVSGASPYFLATRVKNEVGLNGSGSTSGKVSGYIGLYNFFNIGAFDSASGHAVQNGLAWAKGGTMYNRPWTTPYKSIVGGAQYIASGYIAKGQDTIYTQKFNVVYAANLYWNQYMTAVTAPSSYASSTYSSYKTLGLLNNSFTFRIPVYTNMESSACKLPAAKGNPNYYLKNITVSNKSGKTIYKLNQTFNYKTKNYTVVVPASAEEVAVSATPINSKATYTGNGLYYPTKGGKVTLTITCKSESGVSNKYTLTIQRQTK